MSCPSQPVSLGLLDASIFMLDISNMPPRKQTRKKAPPSKAPVQVSLDRKLLQQIDADEEVRKKGRSAFITQAILIYMRAKREKQIDEQFRTALSGQADSMLEEARPFMAAQVWPPEDDLVETDVMLARHRKGA